MTENHERVSRRKLLEISGLGLLSLAGCVDIQTNPRGQEEDTETPTQVTNMSDFFDSTPENTQTPTEGLEIETLEEECTSAYISDFEWESNLDTEDNFYGTVINQGDIAGEIVVQLVFYQSEDTDISTGTTSRSVSIGAQETLDIVINANPPTDDSDWAIMEVSQQDCVADIDT
jgi:hypothetical protein